MKHYTLLPLVLVAALAGCATAPGATSSVTSGAKASTGTTPAATTDAQPATTAVQAGTTTTVVTPVNHSGGTAVSTSIDITAPGATTTTSTGTATAPGSALITAASGGRYLSVDGNLSAQVAPGVLTKDARIAITPVTTASDKLSSALVPGIKFNVDLGGAAIAPGKALQVTTKLDSRFVDAMKQRDPAFTPAKYNLSQDAQGAWTMTMTVNGPALNKATVRPATVDLSPHLIEFGALPLPGAKAAAPKLLRGLFAVGDSSATDCSTFVNTTGAQVPSDINNWYQQEDNGQFSCNVYDGRGWYMNVYYDLTGQKQTCLSTASTDPNAPVVAAQTVDVLTHTTWDSDDPALAGKDASGAIARFDFPWSPSNGPSDVSVDAKGNAQSFTVAGLPLSATAHTDVGPAAGTAVTATAAANAPVIELKCPKFSPKLSFHVSSGDAVMPKTVTVNFTLDGVAQSHDITTAADGKSGDVTFYLIVPDDADHTIKITGLSAGPDLGMDVPFAPDQQAHRNGSYTFAVKAGSIVAH